MVKSRHYVKQAAFGLCAILAAFIITKTILDATRCRNNLRNNLSNGIQLYRLAHEGLYPSDINSVASAFPGLERSKTNTDILMGRLTCPGNESRLFRTTNDSVIGDYIYINWGPHFGTNAIPMDYPLIYDRRLANHWGLGVNVLTSSRSFWDFRAKWLKNFSLNHPEYRLPMPE